MSYNGNNKGGNMSELKPENFLIGDLMNTVQNDFVKIHDGIDKLKEHSKKYFNSLKAGSINLETQELIKS